MKRGVSLFFISILSVAFVFGQEIVTADQYLASVSDQYASIRDYEASIEIRQGNNTMTGNVSHLAPSFMRIDFTRPADQVIVFNGEALVVYLPEYRAVLNQPLNQTGRASNAASAQGLSMLRRNYVASFVTGPNPEPLESGSSERVVKLRLTRRNVSEGFREIILNINPSTKLIRRIEAKTVADTEMRFDFTNIRTNQGVPVARFAYDTPGTASMYNNFLFRDSD
jgi:outer membrane lipoprotein-sorting protein